MAQQRFDLDERHAIYDVYDKRCFHCKEPFDNIEHMIVDHFVAESTTVQKVRQLIDDYGLPKDFHVKQYRNLVACCLPCNGKKGILFSKRYSQTTQLSFHVIEAKSIRVIEHINKSRKSSVESQIRRHIRSGFQSGIITISSLELLIAEEKQKHLSSYSNSASAQTAPIKRITSFVQLDVEKIVKSSKRQKKT